MNNPGLQSFDRHEPWSAIHPDKDYFFIMMQVVP